MKLRDLTVEEFNNFSYAHPDNSYFQSHEYAIVMGEQGYQYEFIGYTNDTEIFAASLILYKEIGGINYGYAPRGFLIDYNNEVLLENFTNDMIEYYYEKEFAFIKINPNIKIGNIRENGSLVLNDNIKIIDRLTNLNYLKLPDSSYFESLLPRYSANVDLINFNDGKLKKYTRNKINKSFRKGLIFRASDLDSISILDKFIDSKNFLYNDFYSTFFKKGAADLFLVKINKLKYLEQTQKDHHLEIDINQELNDRMVRKSHSKNINKKMNSDMILLSLKKDIMDASKLIQTNDELIIGAALVVNYNGHTELIASGYDDEYRRFCPNYFLHYNIIQHYKDLSSSINIGGICSDFTDASPFAGLTRFKCGFKPVISEFIGEFDLIICEKAYKYLLKNKYIKKEFSKES